MFHQILWLPLPKMSSAVTASVDEPGSPRVCLAGLVILLRTKCILFSIKSSFFQTAEQRARSTNECVQPEMEKWNTGKIFVE